MKVSTSTFEVMKVVGDEAGIRMFAEAGFQALDFGLFYSETDYRFQFSDEKFKEYFTRLRKVADDYGIEIHQTHSPMPNYLFTGDEQPGNIYLDSQIKAIHASALMGAKYIVIHPVICPQYRYDYYREETREVNLKYYGTLRRYAMEYGIKIAVENMYNRDPERQNRICPTVCSSSKEMRDYVDMMGRDWFVNCLDLGHAHLTGNTPQDMIHDLGDTIEILHVHDNDGINDLHQAPYTGITDWEAVCKALGDVGYQGTFNFEADNFYTMFGSRLFPTSTKMLYAIGRDLVNEYQL